MKRSKHIQEELETLSPLLASFVPVPVFEAPEGYFEQLPFQISVQVGPDRTTAFTNDVPNNYFDSLANVILNKIQPQQSAELTERLLEAKHQPTFEVPEGYFDQLANRIQQRVLHPTAADEIEQLSPVLAAISREPIFEVPVNYFETLAIKPSAKSPAKVIKINSFKSAFKYAAAAIVVLVVTFGIIKLPSKISGNSIENDMAMEESIERGRNMSDQTFNQKLNELNEDDIIQYLQKTSTDADLTAISSSLSTETLPNEEEHLLDEAALEKILMEPGSNNN